MNKLLLLCIVLGSVQYGVGMNYDAREAVGQNASEEVNLTELDTIELPEEPFASFIQPEEDDDVVFLPQDDQHDDSSVVPSAELTLLVRDLRKSLQKSKQVSPEESNALLKKAQEIQAQIAQQKKGGLLALSSPNTSAPNTPERRRVAAPTLGRQRAQTSGVGSFKGEEQLGIAAVAAATDNSPQIRARASRGALNNLSSRDELSRTSPRPLADVQDEVRKSPRESELEGGPVLRQSGKSLSLRKKKAESGSRRTLAEFVGDFGKKLSEIKSPRSPRVSPRPGAVSELPEGLEVSSKALAILGAQLKETSPEGRRVVFSSIQEGSPGSGSLTQRGSSEEGSSREGSPGRKGMLRSKYRERSKSPELIQRSAEEPSGLYVKYVGKKEFDALTRENIERARHLEDTRDHAEDVLEDQFDQPWVKEAYHEVLGHYSGKGLEEDKRRRSYQDFVKSMSPQEKAQMFTDAQQSPAGGFLNSAKSSYQTFLQRQKRLKEAKKAAIIEEERARVMSTIETPQNKWRHIGPYPMGAEYKEVEDKKDK